MQFRDLINGRIAAAAGRLPLALPCQLGDYRLTRSIGRGALARVYHGEPLACWPPDKRCTSGVAVKVLREKWQERTRVVEQFATEAQVLREVRHPRLIGLASAQTEQPPQHLVMPLVAGCSLATWRHSPVRPALPDALRWGEQIASALQALAAGGWMHSDIKPSNVLVDAAGDAMVIDLGFARRIETDEEEDARPLAGTLNYMAPEWFTRSGPPEIRSDVYSLGIVLFELLAGRLPFPGKTAVEVIQFHRQGTAIALASLRPDLPGNVTDLVHRLLAKRADERPRPADVVQQFQRLQSRLGSVTRAA